MISIKAMLLYFVVSCIPLLVSLLEHEKSFLIQDDVTNGISIALFKDSVLITSSSDLVQKDIETGAIQRTLRAHTNAIYTLTVVEDSQLITAGWDDMIVVWDLDSGAVLRRIRLGSTETFIKSISYENGQIYAGGADQFVRRINLVSGMVVKSWFYEWFISSVVVKDGFLYVGIQREVSQIEKISVSTSDVVLRFEGHTTGVYSLYYYENLLFSGPDKDRIIAWNPETGSIVQTFSGPAERILALVVHEKVLYSAGVDNIIKWNIDDGQLIKIFPALHTDVIRSLGYKNGTLFSGSDDNLVIMWNATDATSIFTYEGRKKILYAAVLWKSFLISGGEDGIIRSWDVTVNSLDPLLSVNEHFRAINCMVLSGDSLFSGGFDATIRHWNLTKFTFLNVLNGHTRKILALIADSTYLYSGGDDLRIKRWEVSTGVVIAEFIEHTDKISSLQLSDTILFSASYDPSIKFWNLETRDSIRTLNFPNDVFALHIAGETLFSGSMLGVHAFSTITGLTLTFQLENIGCISIASWDNGVITGHQDSLVRARDFNSLAIVGIFQGHQDSVRSLTFDSTGTLYTSSSDGSVKRWNMASRKVAFSFENRNSSVTVLTASGNYLYIGVKSGVVNRFDIRNAILDRSSSSHSGFITSFVHVNGSLYSAGNDGTIVKLPSNRKEEPVVIFSSSPFPIRSLTYSKVEFAFIQGENQISFLPFNSDADVSRTIISPTPILCIAAYQSFVISGSKSGIIFVWNMDKLKLEYELRGHTSQVNMVLIDQSSLYSASDDKTIIIWSLEERSILRTLQRLSASALGHLGPVNAISVCNGLLFSVGSDVATRRWNIQTGRHEGVYFGFSKPVTTVICHNRTVIAGSEDFSVLLYKPNIPEEKILSTSIKTQWPTTNRARNTRVVRKAQTITSEALSSLVPIFGAAAGVVALLLIVVVVYLFVKAKSKQSASPRDRSTENEANETTTDLQTVINSVMGISRHAEYLLPVSIIARVKKLTAGGGGEVFIAKVMDPVLSKKYGDTVIQKVVFVNQKSTEESFFQEVGIMIMLSSFPHFCEIIGYTDKPLSMILKYYPDGSLTEWLQNNFYGEKIVVKCTKEISKALSVMHSHYLAHCDIKTQNVLVRVDNGIPSCYLTDFGITQVLSDKILASAMFQVVNLRGLSIPYASPEAFINFRSKNYANINFKKYDIYSLGMILYEVMAKRIPWNLEHEKSFLLKDGSTSVYSVALYRNSLLHTSTSDIVQKDVDTGAFQRTFRAHKGRVMDLIVTNSSTMFSAGIDDTIVMWDLETGAIIKRFRLGASGTLVQSISLQGDHIFAGGIDFKFRQVNVITGIVMRTFDVRSRIEKVVADGDFLYIGKSGIPPLAKVSILNGRNQLIFDEHSDGVFDIRLYNGMLFSASDDAFIVCWNVLNAAIIATYVGHTDGVRVITIWNDVLYSSSKDHTIIKWDISSTEILKISPYFTSSGARSFAFSDSYLISGGTDGILLKWDFNLGSPLFSYSGSDKRLRNVVSWKNYVISGGFTNEIKQWDTSQNSPDPFFIYAGNEESVNCLYIFEDALFSGGLDTLVLLWNLTSMIKSGVLRGHTEGVLAIVADQNFLHSVGDNRNIKQWIWKTGTFNGELLTGTDSIQYLQLSNEGLFSGSEQYVLYKWDVTSKTGIQVFVSLNQIFTIRIFEKYILIGSFGLAKISIENGESIAKSVICLSLVSSYTRIFSGHDDGLIRGRDVLSLGVLETYQGHVDAVFSLSIDEAGALYSASLDGSVRRWSYMTRRTAFSFEDRSGSVSSLTVLENHLFIGTRSGSLNTFDLSDTTIQGSMKMHNAAVTSLITDDSRVFTSGLDGVIFSMRQGFNENASIILNYSPLSLKGLFNLKNVLFFISDDTEIYSIGTNSSNPATKRVTSGIPLNCLSGYNGLILGGSKSGSIFAWSLDTAVLTYELRGHSSQVNSLGVSGDLLVSASDDQSIIIWSLVDMASVNVLKRVSSDSLGHIGPVNSISLCNGYVFSGGSDATTRRWNILSGKHEDVYFGASKSTTTVLCHNETVYTGGEDSAVLMFRPVFSKESNYKSTGTSSRDRRLVQTRLRQRISFSGMIDLQTIIPMIVGFAILAMVILGCTIYIFRYRNSKARRDISPGQKTSSEETSQAVTDLQTVVNSVIGISKHAAFLVEKWAIARDKKIAAGGGGELYLAKIMDPALKRKAREETVIQKVVFLKNKINEEAFFQEVGIMIMLSSFPCFCSIIAYTEDPFSMILKYYPEGALHEWLRSNKYSKKVAVAILSDTASALKIMHSYYLAHCDLKSKNILVELVNGQPSFRLTDFGITQILSEKVMDSRSFKIINLRGLSVDYASPEAFRNFRTSKYVRVDFKMYDIYSYGCLVKEVLTKTSPWG